MRRRRPRRPALTRLSKVGLGVGVAPVSNRFSGAAKLMAERMPDTEPMIVEKDERDQIYSCNRAMLRARIEGRYRADAVAVMDGDNATLETILRHRSVRSIGRINCLELLVTVASSAPKSTSLNVSSWRSWTRRSLRQTPASLSSRLG